MPPAAIAIIGIGMTAMATLKASNDAKAQGAAQQQEMNYEAQQADVNAGQQRAAAQRTSIAQNRQTNVAISNAQAAAASGGGDTTDPSVAKIVGSIAAEGSYRSMAALYQGEDAARNMETGASLSRYQGANAATAGNMKSQTAMLSGASSMLNSSGSKTLLDRYG